MLRSLDKAIIISVLLVTSILTSNFHFFIFYSSDNYGSLVFLSVGAMNPINGMFNICEGYNVQPSTEGDLPKHRPSNEVTDPSSNEVTDPSSNEVTDPSSNEVTDPSSNEVTDPFF